MAGPWEQFQSSAAEPQGPWAQFSAQAEQEPRGAMDKLLGLTGERYQTWPERMVREAVGVPQKMMRAAQSAPAGSREFTEAVVPAATEAAMLATPANPAIRVGERAIPGVTQAFRPAQPKVPTTQELKTAGAADIQAARNSDLDVTSSSVADYSRKLQQELFESGIHPVDAPNTFVKLKELETAPASSVFTAGNLQSLRESFGTTAQNFNPNAAKDQLAASRVIKGFDAFLPSVGQKDVVAGAPATTQGLFETGRGNYAAAMRSNDITGGLDRANTGILERAEVRAQAANSGRNIDNTIRQKVASVLEKPKEISGYNDADLAALNQVVQGGGVRNTARYVGNLMGGGGGMGQSLMTAVGAAPGVATGNIPLAIAGAAVPASVGSIAKVLANQLAKRDLQRVDELLRKRSPLYEQRVANPGVEVISPAMRAALLRGAMFTKSQSPSEAAVIDALLAR